MRGRAVGRVFLSAVLAVFIGCANLPAKATSSVPSPASCFCQPALVLVADGAGNFRAASTALAKVARETHAPVCVEPFVWSHGYCRIFADQIGHAHIRHEGQRLAEQVLFYKWHNPETPIYLMAHSAGSAVVLSAAEWLPPDSVERIILLAPAVSSKHDLRSALVASRQGVDVFYSKADWWYLGMGITLIGTADRRWDAAAGRVGFRLPSCCPDDNRLYDKLRQHPWQACLSWTGNKGGHYGTYQPGFIRLCILPLLGAPSFAELAVATP